MKKPIFLSFFFYLLFINLTFAQNFKFAFVTDTHIGSNNAEEDLERTVADINVQSDINFVVITGDITEMGTDKELALAKEILDKIEIPYYIIPGNHDTGWSESGGVSFIREFGADKFVFEHEGFKIIGCASGPYVRMSDGHIPRDAIIWLEKVLQETPKVQPIIFLNHYPIDNSLDNWYEATDLLKNYNTQFAICGHGHRNKEMNFEGIPATMGRSNLRAKNEIGGYNIVEITQDSANFRERTPGEKTHPTWRRISLGKRDYSPSGEFERPTYTVNDSFPQVKKVWGYHSDANVISTPAAVNGHIIFGNSTGEIEALSEKTGEKVWSYQTEGGIFSSPAAFKENIILGSGDGNIYCLNSENGKLVWKFKTEASVLGSPIVENGIVYIGGSDGNFRAINAKTGEQVWNYNGLEGPVVGKPLIFANKVIFGAWDKNLYALNIKDGSLKWKWNNGTENRMLSPAMVTPVAHDNVVYIVAPDRFISAIDATTGRTLWRSNEATVRESLGISKDKTLVYGKTMNDEIVAFRTGKEKAEIAWRKDFGFGYDHVPSMLIEKENSVYFGTRNGVIYSINSKNQEHNWSYKIDNSMVNTVNVIGSNNLVAATMDGQIVMLKWEKVKSLNNPRVKIGAEQLFSPEYEKLIKGKRVGLVTNQTGLLPDGTHLIDHLNNRPDVDLTVLFGSEHGLRGEEDTHVADGVDKKTGLPIISLYGKVRKPTKEMLEKVDVLIFDIQDIGARYYTYIKTMLNVLEAAAEEGIPYIVLDRPNPITGDYVDGPMGKPLESASGIGNIPITHGMTVGELALMFNGERKEKGLPTAELTVIPLKNYDRNQWYDNTRLTWVKPSPNMLTLNTAIIYPATCLLEGTNYSEARGTMKPFEVMGAPWVDGEKLKEKINYLEAEPSRYQNNRS
jgi:uncharacterized protein YbbC (DUF1343 family)/outer membrane protein assembly factor BamB/predicted phosphodiesterase